jgi:hypothetical protein
MQLESPSHARQIQALLARERAAHLASARFARADGAATRQDRDSTGPELTAPPRYARAAVSRLAGASDTA